MSGNMDVKEISEMLDAVSDKMPKIIKGLLTTLYSVESGKNMGQAVGSFYKEILAAGIPNEDAIKMTKDYMLSLKDITANINTPK